METIHNSDENIDMTEDIAEDVVSDITYKTGGPSSEFAVDNCMEIAETENLLQSKAGDNPCNEVKEEQATNIHLRDAMLMYLANSSTACFKSQQSDEPELDFQQKQRIALEVLTHSPGKFLARFGNHLQEVHLDYFTPFIIKPENYEVAFHIKNLRRFYCKAKHQVDVRNRRLEALRRLIDATSYFDEPEMKMRNPLLYEHLIGQYLSPEEIAALEHESVSKNNTLIDVLLAQIEKDQTKLLHEEQQEVEEGSREEFDTSDEDALSSDSDGGPDKKKIKHTRKIITDAEKDHLKEEFYQTMYKSFLNGEDKDFDYSAVDLNTDYDDLTILEQDEEEKYFDSETPDAFGANSIADSDDELDIFMKNLQPDPTPSELSDQLSCMQTDTPSTEQ